MLNLILDNPKTNRFCLNKFTNSKLLFSLLHPGTPVYFFASLLHMATFGGTGAEALKNGIDSIFAENGLFHLSKMNINLRSLCVQVTAQVLILARKLG